jgi:hypothetical protein
MRRPRFDARRFCHSSALMLGIYACVAAHSARAAGPTADDPFKIFVSDQYSYDDNLYRVPDSVLDADPALANVESFDDYINRLSAGIQARVDASRQVFALNLRVDDVTYKENDDLDYRGGNGDLKWNFEFGKHWAGLIDARYDRAQAGFSNYLLFIKDVVESQAYVGELRFKIGSRWALLGGGAITESTHSAPERQTSNFESESAKLGVEYSTPNQSLIALEYAVTDAKFPVAERLFGRDVGYEQTLPGIRARYVFSEKTRISGRAGYLKRDYISPNSGDYSGNVWNVAAYWEPRAQIHFDVEAWHELKAYVDAEADYFVATGVSVTPTWLPTPVMSFALALKFEDQSYRESGTPFPVVGPGREDETKSAALTWEYTPRDYLDFILTYRWLDRDSNREFRANEAEVASAQVKIAF